MTKQDTLPPLPEAFGLFCGLRLTPPQTTEFWGMLTARETGGEKCNLYTEDQMHTYARAALAAQAHKQAQGVPVGFVKTSMLAAPQAAPAPEAHLQDELIERVMRSAQTLALAVHFKRPKEDQDALRSSLRDEVRAALNAPAPKAGPPIVECYGDCSTGNPQTCPNPCSFQGRPKP